MDNKRFSVFEAATFGIKSAVDNYRLIFFVGLIYFAVIALALCFIIFSIGFAEFFSLKTAFPLMMQECQAGSVQCASGMQAFFKEIYAALPISSLLIVIAITWIILYGFALGCVRIALDLYDTGSSQVRRLLSGFKYILKALLANICYAVITFLGLLLFIIPGIYLMLRLCLFWYFIVDRNAGIIESLKKSYAATAGSAWHMLSLWTLCVIIYGIVGIFGLYIAVTFSVFSYAYVYRKLSGNPTISS